MKWDKKLVDTTYGFDLTPLLWMAWQTGDKDWLEVLHKRYLKDRQLFPEFYQKG